MAKLYLPEHERQKLLRQQKIDTYVTWAFSKGTGKVTKQQKKDKRKAQQHCRKMGWV